jgi:hypothetical protein
MEVFTNRNPSDDDPIRPGESIYSFINRCSEENILKERELIESLVQGISCPKERSEVASRLRSNDENFQSAYAELIIQNKLKECGFETFSHPQGMNDGGARPDFKVVDPKGKLALVEVKNIYLKEGEIGKGRLYLDKFIEYVNRWNVDGLGFSLHLDRMPQKELPGKQIRKEVYSNIEGGFEYGQEVFVGKVSGCNLKIKAVESQGKAKVLFWHTGMQEIDDDTMKKKVNSSLRKKSNKYKNPRIPLVIVANVMDMNWQEDLEQEVIYGGFSWKVGPSGSVAELDGLGFFNLIGNVEEHRSSVSAVIFIKKLDSLTENRFRASIYLNPNARMPIENIPECIDSVWEKQGDVIAKRV